jgi:hypothetical protein
MHDWPPVLVRQVRTLVRQFLAGGGNEAWIGVGGIEYFGTSPVRPGPMRRGGRIETLGNRPLARAFVWMQGAEPELWVDPAASGYRDLYDEFAHTRLGLAGRPTPTTGFNIDHVFPQTAGVLDGLTHVRLMAIGAAANQAAGGTLERAMADRARAAKKRREAIRKQGGTPRDPKPIRLAVYMTLGKATGFIGWKHLPDSTDATANLPLVRALFAHLAACGIHADFPDRERRYTAHTLTRIR